MKRLLLLLLIAMSASVLSAQAMRKAIEQMPDTIFPLLERNDWLDMLDEKEANVPAKVKNRFGKEVEMTQLTAQEAEVVMSSALTVHFTLDSETQRITLTYTYKTTQLTEQTTRHYSLDWKPIE